MAVQAFDLAERFQTPVFVVSDLDIGMNDWMCRRLKWDDDYRPDRGKVLSAEELAAHRAVLALPRCRRRRHRRAHAPRRAPEGRVLHARLGARQARRVHRRLRRVPARSWIGWRASSRRRRSGCRRPRSGRNRAPTIGHRLVRRLPCRRARGARPAARAGDCMRLPARPRLPVRGSGRRLPRRSHEQIFVVEQNRDAQLRSLLTLETGVARDRMTPVLDYGGLPLTAERRDSRRLDPDSRELPYDVDHEAAGPPSRPRGRTRSGFTRRDYEGAMSTLCAGCGHDSVTAALVQAFWELDIPPHRAAKLSGIGCSSKTTAYFLQPVARLQLRARAHAGDRDRRERRQPRISSTSASPATATRCPSASGSSATRSGATCNMLYVLENNGVYGLTKGQFSASADIGSTSSAASPTRSRRSTRCCSRSTLGATFVARSFSGDKAQLVPILKAGLLHHGFALIDIISPCVSFNDHEARRRATATRASTMSRSRRSTSCRCSRRSAPSGEPGATTSVTMHDGSIVRFRSVGEDYDPTDRDAAYAYVRAHQTKGEVVTGLLYIDQSGADMHAVSKTIERPLIELPYEELCPGRAALDELMEEYR